jgi:uncharacterized protein (UPF0261 family)
MRVQARTTIEEMRHIAKQTATQLNKSKAPHLVKFIVPMRGFSSVSIQGSALYNPDADRAFIESLKVSLDKTIEIVEVDDDINSPHFSDVVSTLLFKMLDDHDKHDSQT